MYRQFLLKKEDRKFHRILWRNLEGNIQTYELNTVTFGITPASYLATRCLQQLAVDEGHHFPKAANILQTDFYVDDLSTGAETEDQVREIRNELTQILAKAGLTIRQWASNTREILSDLPSENINLRLQLGDTTLKTLGLYWDSATDSITDTVKINEKMSKLTKRNILSETAKIFDPLGLLARIVIVAKIILQKLC